MSYRQAAAMMREFLPVGDKVNHGTIRNRTLRVGARIDKIVVPQTLVPMNRTSTDWTMAIDGGFVHGRSRGGNGNFELLVGRLKASGVKPYVFAWVRGEVESTVDRISTLATTQSGASRPRLMVITDGANSLQSIYHEPEGCAHAGRGIDGTRRAPALGLGAEGNRGLHPPASPARSGGAVEQPSRRTRRVARAPCRGRTRGLHAVDECRHPFALV